MQNDGATFIGTEGVYTDLRYVSCTIVISFYFSPYLATVYAKILDQVFLVVQELSPSKKHVLFIFIVAVCGLLMLTMMG
jgi:hypothetical protein